MRPLRQGEHRGQRRDGDVRNPVTIDPQPARTPAQSAAVSYGVRRMGEEDHRRILENAGFADVDVRIDRGGLFAQGRKPTS